ncbi:protein FAM53A-like isoform X1 [Biomphalaria pfeifferi]|uniref:Protein FAM53A-like isoform X1 n=1 Tax=Biomphalaria pfeifferi TaxID=112525 RepID=A0AAD8BBK9_BIOPF|nr:protein FAM53A-like isoform X1 [Biomphalaria pfeifferi]
MLAHNGLALITEKLQNQRLEESPQSTNISCSSKSPQESTAKAPCQSEPNKLAIKGTNVWALSLESERLSRHEFSSPDSRTGLRAPDKIQNSNICRHKKFPTSGQICDIAPGTPSAPPKKKHCRSLSVPADGLVVYPTTSKEPSKIWKPIAVIPRSNNNFPEKDRNSLPVFSSEAGTWLPTKSSGFKLVPVVSSPPSVDSGHYTTSDLQTPPGSPVPRPASATSECSFSSHRSAWHDYSPIRNRVRVLENRSLSCEDQISGSSTISIPCAHGRSDISSRCRSNSHYGSISCNSSGIPRCHSQPCVLHHRRCGKKRRRDCDRPTLNFNKMTETAYPMYPDSHSYSELWCSGDKQFDNISRMDFILNTIASSPLDSELPVRTKDSVDTELTQAASLALPLTPPDHSSPTLLQRFSAGVGEEEEEDEDEDTSNCDCHDSRVEDGVGLFQMNDLDLEQIENH